MERSAIVSFFHEKVINIGKGGLVSVGPYDLLPKFLDKSGLNWILTDLQFIVTKEPHDLRTDVLQEDTWVMSRCH